MALLDSCSLKTSLPLLIAVLLIAQIDLASAAAWPLPFLSLLHLTPASDDISRGICAGLGASLDFAVAFQLLRILARRAVDGSRKPNGPAA